MRTVTFADRDLIKQLNSSVIPVWHNQRPDNDAEEPVEQPVATNAGEVYPRGGGGANVRAYFCTPDGMVFHFVEGYWPAADFSQEVKIAQQIFEEVKNKDHAQFHSMAAQRLHTIANEIESANAILRDKNLAEFQKPVRESAIRQQHAAADLRLKNYRAGADMAGKEIDGILQALMRYNVWKGAIK